MGADAAGTVCIQQANAVLGEGPIWDWRSGDLFWVDIRRGHVFRHHLETREQTGQWVFPARVGAVALAENPDRILVASGLQVDWLDLRTGKTARLCDLGDIPGHRVNDAEVDANGRLWLGTMLDDFHRPEAFTGGRLHRIDPDGSVTTFADEFQIPNGIGWSLDQKTMYFNDSAAGDTYAFDFDPDAGTIRNKRVFFQSSPAQGLPDGMSVDEDGNVWSALWDGWNLVKLSPDGSELARYPMPVRRPSSATFCGPDLDQLAITSATVDFTSEDYARSPQAGGLFLMPAGCRGQRPNLFGAGQASGTR